MNFFMPSCDKASGAGAGVGVGVGGGEAPPPAAEAAAAVDVVGMIVVRKDLALNRAPLP